MDGIEVEVGGRYWEVEEVTGKGFFCEAEGCYLPGVQGDPNKQETWVPAVVEVKLLDREPEEGSCAQILCAACFEKWAGKTLDDLGFENPPKG
jgi:hypothetical protein